MYKNEFEDTERKGCWVKVLLLEDVSDMARVIKMALSEYCEITHVENGVEGARLIPTIEQFDLIISDNQMPRMSGIEFIQELRRFNKGTPVVMFTADDKIVMNQEQYKKAYDIQEIFMKDLSKLEHFVRMKKKSLTM